MTEKGQNRAEIVYEDNSSNCPLLVVIHSISVSADWFSATGKALSSANRLLLEVPEYTTFKDGEVLSNKDGSYIFILNTHGKYLTSFYASLNQKGILKIEDGLSAWENQIEKYRFATESERQKLVDALKASKEPKAKEYLKRFFGIEEKPKYEFKPFDKVLVRKEGNKKWNISLFAREIVDDYNRLPYKYECSNGTLWDCCIPYSRPTIEHFITRMVEHNNGIALLFNRLDNKMFQDVVFPKAKGILFMKGRIKFHREDGTIGESPGCGSILVAFGEENAETLRSSNIEGRYIQVNQEPCNTHVDWEQRRYEIAKTILPITSVSGRGPHGELILETCDKAAELAVVYADDLIKKLK